MTELSEETKKYQVIYWDFDKVIDELTDADIPYKMEVESHDIITFEVNKIDREKVEDILVKYD